METTYDELVEFSEHLDALTKVGSFALDYMMPILGEGKGPKEQLILSRTCLHKNTDSYRITDLPHGNHGWYCTDCGKVVQWG
jgi:effector-binding domain-containing protein